MSYRLLFGQSRKARNLATAALKVLKEEVPDEYDSAHRMTVSYSASDSQDSKNSFFGSSLVSCATCRETDGNLFNSILLQPRYLGPLFSYSLLH